MNCKAPVDLDTLLAHWLGELDEADDTRVGEHLMGCGSCAQAAQWVANAASGIRTLVRGGAVYSIVPQSFVQRAVAAGMRTREYRLAPGSSVNCTLAPEDDLLVTCLEAPLAGLDRIDMLMLDDQGRPTQRLTDIPFDPQTGEVLFTSRVSDVRAMPETRFSVRLVTPAGDGDRTLGDYAFHHRPWPGHPNA